MSSYAPSGEASGYTPLQDYSRSAPRSGANADPRYIQEQMEALNLAVSAQASSSNVFAQTQRNAQDHSRRFPGAVGRPEAAPGQFHNGGFQGPQGSYHSPMTEPGHQLGQAPAAQNFSAASYAGQANLGRQQPATQDSQGRDRDASTRMLYAGNGHGQGNSMQPGKMQLTQMHKTAQDSVRAVGALDFFDKGDMLDVDEPLWSRTFNHGGSERHAAGPHHARPAISGDLYSRQYPSPTDGFASAPQRSNIPSGVLACFGEAGPDTSGRGDFPAPAYQAALAGAHPGIDMYARLIQAIPEVYED